MHKAITPFYAVALCFTHLISGAFLKTGAAEAAELAWKIEYDDADRVTQITDPSGRGTKIQYSFDTSKQLLKVVRGHADGSIVSGEFSESGQLERMVDGAGVVSYGYDDLRRLNRVQRQGAAGIGYTYDTLDRIKTLQVGDFYRIEWIYDFLGRLASMKTPVGIVEYEYMTGQGQVIRKLPN
jgi:YD repeat-containing protein